MDKIWLIIQREYTSRVKKNSFLIMTFLGPILMAGMLMIVFQLGLKEGDKHSIIVVDENHGVLGELESTGDIKFEYPELSLSAAKTLLIESNFTGVLHIPPDLDRLKGANFFFKQQPSVNTTRIIEKKLEKLVEELKLFNLKLSKTDYYSVKSSLTVHNIKLGDDGSTKKVKSDENTVGLMFGVAIFFFIFMYGVQVMRGVIEEKSSRIIEVMISSVRPFQLMMGKIVGIAMVGLTQFLLWVILTAVLFTVMKISLFEDIYGVDITAVGDMTPALAKEVQDEALLKGNIADPNNIINRIVWPFMLGMFAFYFIGGYLLYSAFFAAIGSAVDSETDTQQFVMPVTLPLFLAYIVSIFVSQNPAGPLAYWFSIIPLTSPVVMMVRIASGTVPAHEIALSMFLLVIGFLGATWLAAKIYRVGILIYGKKVNYKELWKWITYS